MIAPNGPVAFPKVRGSEKMPEPTTIPVSANSENFRTVLSAKGPPRLPDRYDDRGRNLPPTPLTISKATCRHIGPRSNSGVLRISNFDLISWTPRLVSRELATACTMGLRSNICDRWCCVRLLYSISTWIPRISIYRGGSSVAEFVHQKGSVGPCLCALTMRRQELATS